MEDNIFFSIVIPTYNRAGLVRKTLQGFTEQVFTGFEVIVIDDGGKDNTGEVVKSFGDKRFSYHWKENAERGAARNYGASLAKGSWVNYFDSDDIAYPSHLEAAFRFIAQHPDAKVFHTSFERVDIDTGNTLQQTVQEGELNKKIQKFNPMSCNNVFIKKELCKDFTFSERRELSGTEDWLLWLKLSCSFPFYGLPQITSAIIEHSSRSMITASGKSTEIRTVALLDEIKNENYFNGKLSRKQVNKISAEMFSLSALHYAIDKDKRNTIRTIKSAILSNPGTVFKRRFLAIVKRIIF